MFMKRNYLQYCGLARALDLIGERWTILVVRELLLGPKRFSQLLSALRGISPNLLTTRLKSMVESSVIHKRGREYELTEFGWELEPVLFSMAAWGSKTMADGPRSNEVMDLGWMLLSLTRSYQGGLQVVMEVQVDERVFEMNFTPQRLYVRERVATAPELRLTAPSLREIGQVMKMGLPWNDRVQVKGDLELWEQVLSSLRA